MPKLSRNEWENLADPASEEYSPSMAEVKSERRIQETVGAELFDIEDELSHPVKDPYTGFRNTFGVKDPEVFWERLEYLRRDYLDQVKDPELRKNLAAKILRVEQKIYKQFIPFIESKIAIFGWSHSPLEEWTPPRKLSVEEIDDYFEQARAVLKHFKLSEDELILFSSELDRLAEKLERYQCEATLFTFEKIEEELQKELFDLRLNDYLGALREVHGALDSTGLAEENLLKCDLLLAKAYSLKEIAGRMLHEAIRTRSEARAQALFEYAEYLKAESQSPRELLRTEAEFKDLFQRLKDGGAAAAEEIENFGARLADLKVNKLGVANRKIVERLEKIWRI
jgi:hypothetical protein